MDPAGALLALAALILYWLYLTRWKFRFEDRDRPELKKIVQQKLDALGPLSGQVESAAGIFCRSCPLDRSNPAAARPSARAL